MAIGHLFFVRYRGGILFFRRLVPLPAEKELDPVTMATTSVSGVIAVLLRPESPNPFACPYHSCYKNLNPYIALKGKENFQNDSL